MIKAHLKGLALPLLVTSYPILFLYSHNVWELDLGNLRVPLVYSWLVAALVYAAFYAYQRRASTASLSAAVFMLFYYGYGFLYRLLVDWDAFRVNHFALLPLVVTLAIYAGRSIARLKDRAAVPAQGILLTVAAALVLYNLVVTVPVEVKKAQANQEPPPAAVKAVTGATTLPDIYYIILDEYSSFGAMKSYWKNDDVDHFDAYLQANGFFVAEHSRSFTLSTQVELASRLNFIQYTENTPAEVTRSALLDSKVFQIVKEHGYTTAVLDMAFRGFKADYALKYDPSQVDGMAADDFQQAFVSDTMFSAFSSYFEVTKDYQIRQRNLIFYTLNTATGLPQLPAPKFVFVHVLLPHEPFIFDKNGGLLPVSANEDWHYYLGQYQYTSTLAQQLVAKLLAQADPQRPPVIILQSDHGARNLKRQTKDHIVLNGYLENYDISLAYDILNAVYLPGMDTTALPENLSPLSTMVMALNHYLDANVQIDTRSPR